MEWNHCLNVGVIAFQGMDLLLDSRFSRTWVREMKLILQREL